MTRPHILALPREGVRTKQDGVGQGELGVEVNAFGSSLEILKLTGSNMPVKHCKMARYENSSIMMHHTFFVSFCIQRREVKVLSSAR